MAVAIRQARLVDREILLNLFTAVYGDEVNAMAYKFLSAAFSEVPFKSTFLVAEENGKIIGSAAYSEEMFTVDVWGISWVTVYPEYRSEGVGEKLVKACEESILRKKLIKRLQLFWERILIKLVYMTELDSTKQEKAIVVAG